MTGYGRVRIHKQFVGCNDPHGGHGRVCEGDRDRVWVRHGMVEVKFCVLGACLLSLNLCRRGFQNLLKVRPSSLLMLCGWCISSSVAFLMIRSMYPVLEERSFVSCSLIMWSWLMLCSVTSDLSGCTSLTCLLCSLIRSWMERPLCPI